MNVLTNGRFILGAGAGSTKADFDACGVSYEDRFKLLAKYLPILRGLSNGEQVGTACMKPWATPGGGPRIMLGAWGSGPWVIRAAKEYDGWLASGRFTKGGWLVFFSIIATGMMGVDTNLSLAYQAFVFLSFLFIAALAGTQLSRTRVAAERVLPRFGSVGQPVSYRVTLTNQTAKPQRGLSVTEDLRQRESGVRVHAGAYRVLESRQVVADERVVLAGRADHPGTPEERRGGYEVQTTQSPIAVDHLTGAGHQRRRPRGHLRRHLPGGIVGPLQHRLGHLHHLLDAIRRTPVERFILISSSEVYGTPGPHDLPLTESAPIRTTVAPLPRCSG